MAKSEEYISKIVDKIDSSIDDFNKDVPDIQKSISNKISLMVKDFDIKDGNIVRNVKNLKILQSLKSEISSLVLNDKYKKSLTNLGKSVKEIANLNDKYFSFISAKQGNKPLLEEIKNQSIKSTVESLSTAGISNIVSSKVEDILRQNIVSSAPYSKMQSQIKSYLNNDSVGSGALVKYSKQITTDSLNQFNAQYQKSITDDLGLEWFMYVGSNLETTRPFCAALTKKKWVHISELPTIIKGNIDGTKVPLNPKTELPNGMVAGTNASNFQIYRGGYSCGHKLVPVSEAIVPDNIKAKFSKPVKPIKTIIEKPKEIQLTSKDFLNTNSVLSENDFNEFLNSAIFRGILQKRSVVLDINRLMELSEKFRSNNNTLNKKDLKEYEKDINDAVIWKYTDTGYYVNQTMRDDIKLSSSQLAYTKILFKALEKKKPPFENICYRGIKGSSQEMIKLKKDLLSNIGGTIEWKGFTSTSKSTKVAFDSFGKKDDNGLLFKIKAKGKNGREIDDKSEYQTEQEVLFNIGTKFKIVGETKVDGKTGGDIVKDLYTVIELEEI